MSNPFDQFDVSPSTNPFDQFDNAKEEVKPEGGLIASAKSAFGSLVKGAGQFAGDLPLVDDDNALKRYGQSIIDENPTAVRSLSDIAESPWTAAKEAVGNAGGSIAGMVGARAIGQGITAAAPLTGPFAPATALLGQAVSWLGPAAIAALPSYGSIREKQILNDPENNDDWRSKAIAGVGAATVGAIETKFGPQNWALGMMTKEGREAIAKKFAETTLAKGIGYGALKGGAIEGAEEIVQSPVEQLASYDDPTSSESVKDTLFGGAMGAIGGGVLGGAFGAMNVQKPKADDILKTDNIDDAIAVSQAVLDAGSDWQKLGIGPTDGSLDLQRAGQAYQDMGQQTGESLDAQRRDASIAEVGQRFQDLGITQPADDLAAQKRISEVGSQWQDIVSQQEAQLEADRLEQQARIDRRMEGGRRLIDARDQRIADVGAQAKPIVDGLEADQADLNSLVETETRNKQVLQAQLDQERIKQEQIEQMPGMARAATLDAPTAMQSAFERLRNPPPVQAEPTPTPAQPAGVSTDAPVTTAELPRIVERTPTMVAMPQKLAELTAARTNGEIVRIQNRNGKFAFTVIPKAQDGTPSAVPAVSTDSALVPSDTGAGVVGTRSIPVAESGVEPVRAPATDIRPTDRLPNGTPDGALSVQNNQASPIPTPVEAPGKAPQAVAGNAATPAGLSAERSGALEGGGLTFPHTVNESGNVKVNGDPAAIRSAFPGLKSTTFFADGKPAGVMFGVNDSPAVIKQLTGSTNAKSTQAEPVQAQQQAPSAANVAPDLTLEQQEQMTPVLERDFEKLYQQDIKADIKKRLGLVKETEEDQKRSAFKTFLKEYGINPAHTSDIFGRNRFKANNILPATFRNDGMSLDGLAERAVERGFMTKADPDELIAKIQSEVAGDKQISTEFADEDAAAQHERVQRMQIEAVAQSLGLPFDNGISTNHLASMVNRISDRVEREAKGEPKGSTKADRILKNARDAAMRIEQKRAQLEQQEADYARMAIEEQNALLDILFDGEGNPVIVRKADLETARTWYEQNPDWTSQNETDAGTDYDSGQAGTLVARSTGEGVGNGNEARAQAQPGSTEAQEGLTAPTRAEVLAQQDRAEQAEKQKQREDEDAEAKAKAERIAKEIQARQDASAANFTLGQSAEDSLAGQGSIFDAQTSAPGTPSEQQASKPASEMTASELLRAAADRMDAENKPEAKPAAKIEDAGEKIGGARKDRWKDRGLDLSDLDGILQRVTGSKEAPIPRGDNLYAIERANPGTVMSYKPRGFGQAMFSRADFFYSALSREIDGIKANAAPAIGWLAAIKGLVNKGAVKADEVEWSGIEDWVKLQTGKVTKEQVKAYLDANGVQVTETVLGESVSLLTDGWTVKRNAAGTFDVFDDAGDWVSEGSTERQAIAYAVGEDDRANAETKYDKYTLPGGTNYREVLLTLPERTATPTKDETRRNELEGKNNRGQITKPEFAELLQLRKSPRADDRVNYKSSHWDQPNVLAHLRVNDRTDADGKKVMFVEELQSDWGQDAKKKGFSSEKDIFGDAFGVPSAPFIDKTDKWLALALKRIITMAVQGGYDKVAFVNGEQSAERYDLSKQISRVEYTDNGVLVAVDTNGREAMRETVSEDKIEDYIGKEAARKLLESKPVRDPGRGDINAKTRRIEGDGLKVGGEGMVTFYDSIVPNATKALLKKLGGGQVEMVVMERGGKRPHPDGFDIETQDEVQPGFQITPAMRERANGGLPLFAKRQAANIGLSIKSVQDITNAIASRWANAPEIVVAADMNDTAIPQAVRDEDAKQRSQGASGTPEGFYYGGKVYVVASELNGPKDVIRVLMHEALGHAGLRGVFGKELETILRQIVTMRRKDVAAKAKQYGLDMSKPDEALQAAEEVLAEMSQTKPEIGFVKRAIAVIRNWLRANVPGFSNLTMKDADIIQAYILPARAFVERGAGKSGGVLAFMRGTNEPMTNNNVVGNQGGRSADDSTPGSFKNSKVVDAKGNLLTVYHGTIKAFDDFDPEVEPYNYEADRGKQFFLDSAKGAGEYAIGTSEEYGGNPNIRPVHLNIQNPRIERTDLSPSEWWDANGDLAWKFDVAPKGHDGMIIYGDGEIMYVTSNPKQIRSIFEKNESTAPDSGGVQFSRSIGDTLNDAANNVRNVKLPAGYLVSDLINTAPGKLGWWHKTVGTQYHLAQKSKPFKRVYDAVQNFIDDVSYFATEAADLAPNILPKLETWKDIGKSPLSAEDTRAFSASVFEGTLNWARDESGKAVKQETLEAAAKKLTVDQKAQRLLRGNHLSDKVLNMWRGLPIDQYEAMIESKYERDMLKPGVVFTDAELKQHFNLTPNQIKLYREFRKATDKSLTNLAIADMLRFGGKDVEPIRESVLESKTVTEAADTLSQYLLTLTDIEPNRSDVLIDTANKMIDKGDKAQDLMDRGYAPLSRFGQYTLDVVDESGERVYFGMFESRWEAAKMNRNMKAEYPNSTIVQGTLSEESYKLFAGVSPETLELFGDMIGLESQGDTQSAQAFQEYLKLAKSNRSAMKRLIQRKGIAGFNEDAGRVLAGFVYSNARQTSTSLHMGEMTNAANDMPKQQGELKDAAVKLVDYIKNPQEEAQAFRGLLFAQYIGGSVASAMVNITQPLTMTLPWLSQYGGAVNSAKQITSAMKDALKKTTGNARLDAAMHRAEEDGTVSPQEVHQLMQQSQGNGALRSGDGTMAGNASAKAYNALSRFSLGWGKLFSTAEQFNRRVTFIAAYRTAIDQKMADPDGFARKAIHETQGVYNKGNKPKWARGAVGSTLFTFKQYSIAYVEMLQRMANNGPEGKKAALLALGVLFLLSGASGMPGADDLDDIISGAMQSMGYNFDSKQKRKEFFVSLFGEGLAQFLEKGVSGIPGVPIDVSGRMGLGNLIPATGLLQKKPDHTRDLAEIAGPAGDFIKRSYDAAGKLIKGDVLGYKGAIATAAPKAAQNLYQAFDMANMGMYRDQNGKKVLDTDAGDAFVKALGFQPNDIAKVQNASFDVQRMIGLNKIRESEIADKWAKGLFEKDQAKVKEAREELLEWNRINPESPIKIKFQQVFQRVRKMKETKAQRIAKTAPKELRAAVREELALQ